MSPGRRREMVNREHPKLPIVRQCMLLGVSRSSLYYRAKGASEADLSLMREMDRQYLETPFEADEGLAGPAGYTSKPEAGAAADESHGAAGHLQASQNQPTGARVSSLSLPGEKRQGHPAQPGVGRVTSPICPWPAAFSTWRQSWTGTAATWWPGDCPTRWRPAFAPRRLRGRWPGAGPRCSTPAKAVSSAAGRFTQVLQDRAVKISMDRKGRYQGNIFVERLWRTVKYEEVYLKAYVNAVEARRELGAYFRFYNNLRPQQALGYQTPAEVFHGEQDVRSEDSKDRRCAPGEGSESLAGPSLNSALILSN